MLDTAAWRYKLWTWHDTVSRKSTKHFCLHTLLSKEGCKGKGTAATAAGTQPRLLPAVGLRRQHKPLNYINILVPELDRAVERASNLSLEHATLPMDLHTAHLPVHTVASHGQTRTAWTAQVCTSIVERLSGPGASELIDRFCYRVSATARQRHAFDLLVGSK